MIQNDSLKYKFAAADMDGTLLNDQNEITPFTCQTIHQAVQSGLLFSLCTGRPIQGVQHYLEQLALTGPVITYNGAMILEWPSGTVLFQQNLDTEDARQILLAGQQAEITMCIWSQNKLYGNLQNDRLYQYGRSIHVVPQPMPEISQLLQQGITKILWYDEVSRIHQLETDLTAQTRFPQTTFCTSKPFYLEFFHKKASKAAAIDEICKLYHISLSQTIAIGDGFNDLSMISHAGIGAAMKNAPEPVKKAADYVTTKDNNEDGVAQLLQHFVLS